MSTPTTSATPDAQQQQNAHLATPGPAAPATPAPLTPQDVLADGQEQAEFNGVLVRKGSIAAFIGNAKALENLAPGTSEYEAVAQQIRDLKPALDALELFDVVEIRNPDVAALLASGPR
ncbi:hypothetical protein OG863_09050 [Streptomyces decoyicus]|uniref:Preprotein translocase subunit SecD n=1 Tax=Streptomyces decoyicus TaxID=249567 RepID=A0ABZ1FD73_9ACTN|nr:hypothetical protein [Streptomyces decoyicus]WSB68096.1 hypothetical protein OG863_09050 [Streptomyces decoyicus]